MSKQVRITHVGGSVSGGTHRNIGVDGGRFFSIHPGLADKLGMDVGEHGTLLFIPKSEKVEGAVEALAAYLEEYQCAFPYKCAFPSECRNVWEPLIAAARAELVARSEGRLVEVEGRDDLTIEVRPPDSNAVSLSLNAGEGIFGKKGGRFTILEVPDGE